MPAGRRRSGRASAASSTPASHIERLLADLPPHCGIVTCSTAIRRRSPGSAPSHGHRTRSLGVEHFGQTGSIPELYRHYGIDAKGIVAGGGRCSRRAGRCGTCAALP